MTTARTCACDAPRCEREGCQDKPTPRRAYRYRIIESRGCLAEQAPVDSHVIDWQHMSQEYTWTVYDFTTGEVTGSMTGVFTDKGYKTEDGTYAAD